MENNLKDIKNFLLNNPLETSPGLTIDDLNKYLSAVQTSNELFLTQDKMVEGLFLSDCLVGLKKVPNESIDLIITEPPLDLGGVQSNYDNQVTLQEYYKWNNNWLFEANRVLKKTGSIYILTSWQYSSMYHSLLSNMFKVQSRIIWKNGSSRTNNKTWINDTSDIWFATKTEKYLFKGFDNESSSSLDSFYDQIKSNLWVDIPKNPELFGKYSQKIYLRILKASSISLNWVLDPFMALGDVGVASKKLGRRFIGFEEDKDSLLLAMKRIDKN